MNIPKFWADYTIEVLFKNKQTNIKRFGWSDKSLEDASNHALQRCKDAEQNLLTKGRVKRIEGESTYLDQSNLPIREEVVTRYSNLNCVTTINSYGAMCLNVEDVMILDLDNDDIKAAYLNDKEHLVPKNISLVYVIPFILIFSVLAGRFIDSAIMMLIFLGLMILLILTIHKVNIKRYQQWLKQQGGYLGMLESYLESFLSKYPDMAFNLYQTPLGWRLIALDNTYAPDDKRTLQCFDELPIDQLYVRLCKVQQCFRARVTAKPWNIGMKTYLPSRVFWKNHDKLPARQEWLATYHKQAEHYAACRFIQQIGERQIMDVNSDKERIQNYVDKVVMLHDELCRSHSKLSIG